MTSSTRRRPRHPKPPREYVKLRRPKGLSEFSEILFPHSPIEVQKDFTIIGREPVYEWHAYVEGEWEGKELLLPDLSLLLFDIIAKLGEDWPYPSTRVNPTWRGWERIQDHDLLHFAQLSQELSDGDFDLDDY